MLAEGTVWFRTLTLLSKDIPTWLTDRDSCGNENSILRKHLFFCSKALYNIKIRQIKFILCLQITAQVRKTAHVLTRVTWFLSLSFPRATISFPIKGPGHRRRSLSPYRIFTWQCIFFHALGQRRCRSGPLRACCKIVKQYGIVPREREKISYCHLQRLPLLNAGMYEYAQVVIPDTMFSSWLACFLISQHSSVIALCQCLYICIILLSGHISMWLCAQEHTKIHLLNPFLLDIWVLPLFFHLMHGNK